MPQVTTERSMGSRISLLSFGLVDGTVNTGEGKRCFCVLFSPKNLCTLHFPQIRIGSEFSFEQTVKVSHDTTVGKKALYLHPAQNPTFAHAHKRKSDIKISSNSNPTAATFAKFISNIWKQFFLLAREN